MSKSEDTTTLSTVDQLPIAKQPTELVSENYDVATTIVFQAQGDMSGTLGVLLTLAEVAMPGSPALKSYKDQIRREFSLMRNRIQDNVYVNLGVQEHYSGVGAVYLTTESGPVQ